MIAARVLVCGSRTWEDYPSIFNRILMLADGTTVVHGGAAGADELAGRAARELGFTEEVHPADWDRWGKRAGFRRNREMIDSGVDLVIAFHRGNSPGTAHTISLAKGNIPLEVHYWPPRVLTTDEGR